MKIGKSELVLVIDRSGSMLRIKKDVEGGAKALIEDQKKQPGECYVTEYYFDDTIEKRVDQKNIKDINGITVEPRGGTALLDAIGRATNEVGVRLSKTDESDRPEAVIFVVLSDGQENASKEFTQSQIQTLVKHQQEKYNWRYIYIGANQDAVLNGQKFGFSVTDSMTYATNSAGINASFNAISSKMSSYRMCVDHDFSEKDRKAALGVNLDVQNP